MSCVSAESIENLKFRNPSAFAKSTAKTDFRYYFLLVMVIALLLAQITSEIKFGRKIDALEDSIGSVAIKAYTVGLQDGRDGKWKTSQK